MDICGPHKTFRNNRPNKHFTRRFKQSHEIGKIMGTDF